MNPPRDRSSGPANLSQQKARQGITLGHVRYVLAISLTLAIIAGALLWLTYF